MAENIIRPVEWWIAENERLRLELDEINKLFRMSARLSLQMIDELVMQEIRKLKKKPKGTRP